MSSKKWMFLAVISFCLLAISVKEINSNISSVQIIFFRSAIGLLMLSIFFRKKLPSVNLGIIKKHLFRNIFHLIGQYGWIVGIIYLSISEVTAIEFTVPIWVILIASLFLREKITFNRGIAVLCGLIGVLFILQPGIAIISLNSIIVLLSAVSYAITHILTKKIVASSTPLEIIFIMCLLQTPIAFLFALPKWNLPTVTDFWWLSMVAISALVAHFSMAKAFQNDNISKLIIIDYIRLPILVLVGIMFYNEPFNYSILIGGSLIIGGNFLNNRSQ